MTDIEKQIGGKITEIRLAQKLTQAQLAEKVDLSVVTISRMERGVSFPSLKTIEKIANALDVPLWEFFCFDEHKPKDADFERELSKLISFLRTLKKQDIILIHRVLKIVWKSLKESSVCE